MAFWKLASVALAAFLIGWFASQASLGGGDGITGAATAAGMRGMSPDLPSPSDHLDEGQISVFDNKVVIGIENVSWATFTDTNSMDPVLDEGANTLEIEPQSQESVKPGDIISYSYGNDVLIHRVVGTGEDDLGWYCLVKGDNANDSPATVRFQEINGIVIGILY
ncbi:MAG: S26 family signal peptidase [Candidatus Aenigmarchaeota archaeon]